MPHFLSATFFTNVCICTVVRAVPKVVVGPVFGVSLSFIDTLPTSATGGCFPGADFVHHPPSFVFFCRHLLLFFSSFSNLPLTTAITPYPKLYPNGSQSVTVEGIAPTVIVVPVFGVLRSDRRHFPYIGYGRVLETSGFYSHASPWVFCSVPHSLISPTV